MVENPADRAAIPEDPKPDAPIYAAGIGPGNPAYLTPRAQEAIASADVVVGFESVVDRINQHATGDLLSCGYEDQTAILDEFGTRVDTGASGTAVLMGDPNVSGYQFLGRVEAAVDRPIRLIPGISSIQIAASRARTPLEDACFVTLHQRGSLDAALSRLTAAPPDRHLLVLPRPFDWMPEDIAAHLLAAGVDGQREARIFERLTHDTEECTTQTLEELATGAGGTSPEDSAFGDLTVVVIRGQS